MSEPDDAIAPPPADEPAEPRARRLHPVSILVNLGGAAIKLLLPVLGIFLVAGKSSYEVILAMFFIPTAIYEVIRYLTVRYRLEADEIIVTEGVITRSERHIPFARIQNVDLVQSVAHRLFKVAEVRIETAAGSEPEAVLKVLSLSAVTKMRRQIFADREPPTGDGDRPSETDGPAPLIRLGSGELVKLGLIANRGLAVVAAAFAAAWEFDLFERAPEPEDLLPGSEAWFSEHLLLAVALLAGLALTVICLLSIGWSVVRLHSFRLDRVGEDLRLSCGLLTRLSATVPRHRIQFVSVQESPLHRLFGRVTIRVETAGSGEKEETNISRKWLIPLCAKEDAAALLEELQPGFGLTDLRWHPLGAAGRSRLRRRNLIVALVLSAIPAVASPWGALALVVTVPGALWLARREGKYLAWARTPSGFAFRNGALTRRLSSTPFSRVQVVSLGESPFDRRREMASLRIDTAGAGAAGHRIKVPYLDRTRAIRLGRGVAAKAESSGFSW